MDSGGARDRGATTPQAPATSTPQSSASIADTFDLVSIHWPSPSDSLASERVCAPGAVAWSYYVLRSDSTYQYRAAKRAGCPTAAMDILQKDARYSSHGDTVFTYLGDGDEEFQSVTLLRWVCPGSS